MTDLTKQKNTSGRSHTATTQGPTDAATAARRRLIATNKPPTRILFPGIDPMSTTTSSARCYQRKLILTDIAASSFASPSQDTTTLRRSLRADGPTPFNQRGGDHHIPTTVQVIEDMSVGEVDDVHTLTVTSLEEGPATTSKTPTTTGGGVKVPLPPAPYSPRTDPRIKPRTLNRYTTSTQRGEFHQNRLVGMALRKRLSATDGAISDALVKNLNSIAKSTSWVSSKSATAQQLRITNRPTQPGGALCTMDARAEELEVGGFEALGVNTTSEGGGEAYLLAHPLTKPTAGDGLTLPTIQRQTQRPPPLRAEGGLVSDRSHALLTSLLTSMPRGNQKSKLMEETTLELPRILGTPSSSSPRNGSIISVGVLREREIGAVIARKEVAALAARAAAQLGLVEAMSSLATPKEVLPSRCTYASLHPLDLIRELPTSMGEAPGTAQPSDTQSGGGGLPCANLGWELFLDSLHPTTITAATSSSMTHALAKSVLRVSPKRNQMGIASSSDNTQAMGSSGKVPSTLRQPHRPPQPRHHNNGVSHSARAPASSSTTASHPANDPDQQQLWSWGSLERLAMAEAKLEGTARARCLPGRNTAMSEEAALRRAQLDREALQLARQEATGGTLTANERRRRTTILASRNPSMLNEEKDDVEVSRASDKSARSAALANLALYEADPTLFSVLGEDTCVVEFPTFPFASERETAAFRILQEAHQGSSSSGIPVQGGGSGAKKVEDAEAEKKRLERAVMARYLYTNREAFDQQDKPSDDWRVWKRSAGAVATASASLIFPRVRQGRGSNGHTRNKEKEEEPTLAPSEVLDKVDLEDRLTILWQVSQRAPRSMDEFIQTQLRAGRDAAKDAEEEVKPYPANRLI